MDVAQLDSTGGGSLIAKRGYACVCMRMVPRTTVQPAAAASISVYPYLHPAPAGCAREAVGTFGIDAGSSRPWCYLLLLLLLLPLSLIVCLSITTKLQTYVSVYLNKSLQVVPLKLLQKAPRGSTAKAHHHLKPNSRLTYADTVQVREQQGVQAGRLSGGTCGAAAGNAAGNRAGRGGVVRGKGGMFRQANSRVTYADPVLLLLRLHVLLAAVTTSAKRVLC